MDSRDTDFSFSELMDEAEQFFDVLSDAVISLLSPHDQDLADPFQSACRTQFATAVGNKPFAEQVLNAAYTIVNTHQWDHAFGDMSEHSLIAEQIYDFTNVAHLSADLGGPRDAFPRIKSILTNALRIYDFEVNEMADTKTLAILARMSEGSVRNALRTDPLDLMNATVKEIESWLGRRRGYRPVEYIDSRWTPDGDRIQFRSIPELRVAIFGRAKALNIEASILARSAHGDSVEHRLAVSESEQAFPYSSAFTRQLVDALRRPECAIEIAKLLELDVPVFVNQTALVFAQSDAEELRVKRISETEEALTSYLKTTQPDVFLQNDSSESEPTAALIRECLKANSAIRVHPKDSKPNSKIEGYVVIGSDTEVAHEYNHRQQNLWVEQRDLSPDLLNISHDLFPASEINKDGVYGRHSGLKKYPRLATGTLFRFKPKTMAEVIRIIAAVIEEAASR